MKKNDIIIFENNDFGFVRHIKCEIKSIKNKLNELNKQIEFKDEELKKYESGSHFSKKDFDSLKKILQNFLKAKFLGVNRMY